MPNKLIDLHVSAVAGVDQAANKRKWLIVKRAPDEGVIHSSGGGGHTEKPNWFQVVKNTVLKMMGRAQTTNEILEEQEVSEQWYELQDALWSSIWSIRHSEEDATTRATKLRQSIEEFVAQATPLIERMSQDSMAMAKSFVTEIQKLGPDPSDLDEVVKALSDARAERISFSHPSTAPINKKEGEDPVTLDEFLKSLTAEKRAEAEAEIAKRAPAPAKFELPEEVKKQLDAVPQMATQIAELTKRADTAETKAAVAETELVKEREIRVSREFVEKGAKYPSAGTPTEVADILRKAYGLSDEYGKQVEATLAKSEAQLNQNNAILKEYGRAVPAVGGNSAEERLEKRATEAFPTLSKAQAYSEFLKTDEGKALYAESLKEAN